MNTILNQSVKTENKSATKINTVKQVSNLDKKVKMKLSEIDTKAQGMAEKVQQAKLQGLDTKEIEEKFLDLQLTKTRVEDSPTSSNVKVVKPETMKNDAKQVEKLNRAKDFDKKYEELDKELKDLLGDSKKVTSTTSKETQTRVEQPKRTEQTQKNFEDLME